METAALLEEIDFFREKVLEKGKFNDFIPELSELLSNDYVTWLHGHLQKKVRDILERYIECSDRDALLQDIEENSEWPISLEKATKVMPLDFLFFLKM